MKNNDSDFIDGLKLFCLWMAMCAVGIPLVVLMVVFAARFAIFITN